MTPKQYYDSFVKKINLTNERRLNLRNRYLQINKKWNRNLFVYLFHKRRLASLSKSLGDIDLSFNDLTTKRSFLWGMVSNACTVEEELSVCKQFDYTFEQISSLEKKLNQIDKKIQKYEKK